MTPPSGSPANRAMNRAQQSGITADIREGFSAMGKGFAGAGRDIASTAEAINRGPDTSKGPWHVNISWK